METNNKFLKPKDRIRRHLLTDTSKTFRALRLKKGLSRAEAGELCGASARAFEQLENGRCLMTSARIERYVRALGYDMLDFESTRKNVREILKELGKRPPTPKAKGPSKLRRNFHKIITKEVRVIRILRKKQGLTQYEAASLCGYVNSIFGQIENGRIELPRHRIEHIIGAIGASISEFDRLMNAEILRDEMIEHCINFLETLEDTRLQSAQTVLEALMK